MKYFRFQITTDGEYNNYKLHKGVSKKDAQKHIDFNKSLGIELLVNHTDKIKSNEMVLMYKYPNLGLITFWGYIKSNTKKFAGKLIKDNLTKLIALIK